MKRSFRLGGVALVGILASGSLVHAFPQASAPDRKIATVSKYFSGPPVIIKSEDENDCVKPLVEQFLADTDWADRKVNWSAPTWWNRYTHFYSFTVYDATQTKKLFGQIKLSSQRGIDNDGNFNGLLRCHYGDINDPELYSNEFYLENEETGVRVLEGKADGFRRQ